MMNLKSLSNQDLMNFHEKVSLLHMGCIEKTFVISSNHATIHIRGDSRLHDLLWTWFTESHNELVDRFAAKFPQLGEDGKHHT